MKDNLALFDLDHTLIPKDSDLCWTEFLIKKGVVEKKNTRANENFFNQYNDGSLDINEFLAFQLRPLCSLPKSKLIDLREEFVDHSIRPIIIKDAINLVNFHLNNEDLCAIVTATNEFITSPIAKIFNIPTLIATNLEVDSTGEFTGKASGVPNFQEGKVVNVLQWLATKDLSIDDFKKSFFYSDSINDLPLLSRVNCPVATNPDKKLREHAEISGWQIKNIV